MIIKNAQVYIDGGFRKVDVRFDSRVREVGIGLSGADVLDADGLFLIPGLIDIHTHGAVGCDAGDGSAEGLTMMSRYYAGHGVTSWCPTMMTLDEPSLTNAVRAVRNFVPPEDGAKAVCINLEGPFLSRERCGAQNPDYIHAPDASMFYRLYEESSEMIQLVTVAPEEPGAIDFVRDVSKVCTVSIGHTNADYKTAAAAFDAGASHVTHLFNAMSALGHRAPGVIGAAFDKGVTAELIADGFHIDPAVIRMTYQLFGKRLVLISDSLRCAGMPDGDYDLSGQQITLRDGKATLSGTDTLAGSSINLMDGLRRAVSFGVPLEDAIYAATKAPARVIGKESEIGSITPGNYADLVLLDKDLKIHSVYVRGYFLLPSLNSRT